MLPPLRKRQIAQPRVAEGSVSNSTLNGDNLSNAESKSKSWWQRFRNALPEVLQDYDKVHSILVNFGVVTALLLSIHIALMMSVPVEESIKGDILSLSLSSPHFRCHVRSLNNHSTINDTIEICSPKFTKSLFQTTNATVICNNGNSLQPVGKNRYSLFYCAVDVPRAIRGNSTDFTGRKTKGSGCSPASFKEAYRVANTVSEEDYLEYLMQEITASDGDAAQWFGYPGKFSTCRPSAKLASLGFKALLYFMFALFWDLFLLVSLTFTSASTNPSEMALWWFSGGFFGALVVLAMLLNGTIHFLFSLEYVVAIRFVSPYDQLVYKIDFMDFFIFIGIWISLLIVGLHYVSVKSNALPRLAVWLLVRSTWKPNYNGDAENDLGATDLGDSDTQPCHEIYEIQDETKRYHTKCPFINSKSCQCAICALSGLGVFCNSEVHFSAINGGLTKYAVLRLSIGIFCRLQTSMRAS